MTFTTAAFDRRSSWRFEALPYKTAPKGPPSSLVQFRTVVFRRCVRDTRPKGDLQDSLDDRLPWVVGLCSFEHALELRVSVLAVSGALRVAESHRRCKIAGRPRRLIASSPDTRHALTELIDLTLAPHVTVYLHQERNAHASCR